MAGIKFNDYITSKIYYERNPNFIYKDRLNVNPFYECEITENELEASVKLKARVGLEKDPDIPFSMEIEIIGFFEYIPEESEDIGFEDYLMTNSIAILFPYLRAVIADITARSNEFPALNLPVANISKMMSDQDTISYTRISKNDKNPSGNDE